MLPDLSSLLDFTWFIRETYTHVLTFMIYCRDELL